MVKLELGVWKSIAHCHLSAINRSDAGLESLRYSGGVLKVCFL